ncbi:bifunctional riboflavin kinase/FAD synthetase [Candidatus Dehalogenimonas loeffleri]|uniref:Riboflavin biosynthesis protein n=1 Tax=Candidatus Dehalogenimonas loeffleri TaxID=3127115 RepID=A0ABZ2J2Q9_9CHLR
MTQLQKEFKSAELIQPTVLTVGVFDGVHLGHQALLKETVRQAVVLGLASAAVTFIGHPRLVLGKHRELPHLTSIKQRLNLIKAIGIKHVVCLTFSEELAALSAEQFTDLLVSHLSMRRLVIGPDFTLGRDRSGNAAILKDIGARKGFSLTVVEPEQIDNAKISSTLIRKAMTQSDMERVHQLLGRCFSLEGRVITGEGRGMGLGIPTANLEIAADQALPADGVYATRALIAGQYWPAITNIGTRPTFGGGKRSVETHIFDFNTQVYDDILEIAIIKQIRPEIKFDSVDSLKKQIEGDILRARTILAKAEC